MEYTHAYDTYGKNIMSRIASCRTQCPRGYFRPHRGKASVDVCSSQAPPRFAGVETLHDFAVAGSNRCTTPFRPKRTSKSSGGSPHRMQL